MMQQNLTDNDRKITFEKFQTVGLFKHYTQLQVDSINAILDNCAKEGITDKRYFAYIFATAYHEAYNYKSGERIVPIQELGSLQYLKSKSYYPYYGRGLVQITWRTLYEKFGKILNIDLVGNPNLALDVNNSAFILVYGMMNGSFTGKRLCDYINDNVCDYVGARKIINGQDKAQTIAGYAKQFENCF